MTRPLSGRRALVALLTVVALGLVGCDAADPPAATVDGADVDDDFVIDLIEALRPENEEMQGEGDETVGTEAAASILGAVVDFEIVEHDVETRGVEVTAEDRRQARSNLPQLLADQDEAVGQRVLRRLSSDSVERLVGYLAAQSALQRELGETADLESEARAFYEDNQEAFTNYCVSVMTLRTEEEAAEALDEVEDGTPFADVAQERSIDDAAERGGDLGCEVTAGDLQVLPPQAAEDFADASEGDLLGPYGPVGTEGATFIVFRFGETEVQPFAEVRDQVLAQLESRNLVETRLRELRADAEVTVDPRFGRWDADVGVLPPRRVRGTPEPPPLQAPG